MHHRYKVNNATQLIQGVKGAICSNTPPEVRCPVGGVPKTEPCGSWALYTPSMIELKVRHLFIIQKLEAKARSPFIILADVRKRSLLHMFYISWAFTFPRSR